MAVGPRCFPAIWLISPRFRGVALVRRHESAQTSGPLRSEKGRLEAQGGASHGF
jgi:hypothetical protein